MTTSDKVWMVRTGNDSALAEVVEARQVVALGWPELGDLSALATREALKARYREALPDESERSVGQNAGQLLRFVREMAVGDWVLTDLPESDELLIGRVAGPYAHQAPPVLDAYPHVRMVSWLARAPRDAFSPAAQRSLGSPLTVYSLDDYVDELRALVPAEPTQPEAAQAEAITTASFPDEVTAEADALLAGWSDDWFRARAELGHTPARGRWVVKLCAARRERAGWRTLWSLVLR